MPVAVIVKSPSTLHLASAFPAWLVLKRWAQNKYTALCRRHLSCICFASSMYVQRWCLDLYRPLAAAPELPTWNTHSASITASRATETLLVRLPPSCPHRSEPEYWYFLKRQAFRKQNLCTTSLLDHSLSPQRFVFEDKSQDKATKRPSTARYLLSPSNDTLSHLAKKEITVSHLCYF